MKSVESDRGSPFCKKGLPGPLPKNSYDLQPLPPRRQGLKLNPCQADAVPFECTVGLPVPENACNNCEFLKGVQGEIPRRVQDKKFPPAILPF